MPELGNSEKYREKGKRLYELKNHLGNVISVVSDRLLSIDTDNDDIVNQFKTEIVRYSDYYPFGFEMAGRADNSESYRNGFNGMEKDKEFTNSTSHYDFGARIYDSRLGRWLAVDPRFYKYCENSSYHFGYNSPLVTIDVDGEENVIVVGRQHTDGQEPEDVFHGQQKFLDNAISIASLYKEQNNGEKTTIMLIETDYTQKQIDEYKEKALAVGANLQTFKDDNELIEYINDRKKESYEEDVNGETYTFTYEDLITDFTYIGYGYSMGIQMGNVFNEEKKKYDIDTRELSKIRKSAFSKNSVSMFISCSSGVDGKEWTIAGEFSKFTKISIGSNKDAYFLTNGKFEWQEGYSIFEEGKLNEKTDASSSDTLTSEDTGGSLTVEKNTNNPNP